ncbi:MAG: alcohol dehydrogenase [Spirochaetae bacterium HGW-Spirochaetae-4]|nr:MAG: alcohol dehydrogenase [Spirochaetae bacterium HGW-Spirochaetae-4]HCS36423.1 alcohol dehydrogenase [Sphaerochaeta sp.]
MDMKLAFDLASSNRTILGVDSINTLGSVVKAKGYGKVVVLMDSGIEKSGIGERLLTILKESDIEAHSISDLPREPGVPDVDRVMEQVKRFSPDCVIAVGGGSVLDIGKLCAVLASSELTVLDLLDGVAVPPHATFTILVPTTAGTGSEATKNAIIAIPSRKTKGAVVHELLLPNLVILDPVLTVSMPPAITATTGMDALCHAMECYLSQKANVLSDLLAVEAIRLIAGAIRKAYEDGTDMTARSEMLLASYYAGMCITLSGTNAVHAMSYPLGTTFHIPHGQSNAMLLPLVMKQNLTAIPEKTRILAECFGYRSVDGTVGPAAYMDNELNSLLTDLEITRSLGQFGVKLDDLDALVGSAYGNRRLMDNNPMEWTEGQIEAIYRELLEEM